MQSQSLRVLLLSKSTVKSRFSRPILRSISTETGRRLIRTRAWPIRIGADSLGASHRCPRRLMSGGGKGDEEGSMYLIQAGLPLFLFCGLGVWVVSNGIDGKNRERDAFQGRISKSERQAVMDKEHDDMMNKLNRMMEQDFDNTKRIERPDEVLARRRKEREMRSVWYRRIWNNLTGR